MLYRFIGMWVLRRAYRLLTADNARPLKGRLTHEAKRILIGAAITLALIVLAIIVLIALLVVAVT